MFKRFMPLFVVVMALALVLSACAPAATPAPADEGNIAQTAEVKWHRINLCFPSSRMQAIGLHTL